MTPEAHARYMRALERCSELAREEFEAIYWSLDHSKPVECKAVLLEAVPAIVEKYGKMAATCAAEFYEGERMATVGGAYRARIAPMVDAEAVRAKVRYALGHLFPEGKMTSEA